MTNAKSDIIGKYVVKRTVEAAKPTRNLQPEIGRIKAVIASLETINTTRGEWQRLDAELTRLVNVVHGKLNPISDIRVTKDVARYTPNYNGPAATEPLQ